MGVRVEVYLSQDTFTLQNKCSWFRRKVRPRVNGYAKNRAELCQDRRTGEPVWGKEQDMEARRIPPPNLFSCKAQFKGDRSAARGVDFNILPARTGSCHIVTGAVRSSIIITVLRARLLVSSD